MAVAIPSLLPVEDQLYPEGTHFRLRVVAEASCRRVGQFQYPPLHYPPQHQPPYRRLKYRSC